MSARPLLLAALGALMPAACAEPPPSPNPPGTFAFGVFGDGPYSPWEQRRFRRLLDDVSRSNVQWLIHVGDILDRPCSDELYEKRRDQLNAVDFPVIYTPGDNEWTDCHTRRRGGHDPLERLAAIRRVFFRDPHHSLGNPPLPLETQADDPAFGEFVENARWVRGGFVFSTIHVVGSSNGLDAFPGRTAAHDAEVQRRTAAAVDWIDRAFTLAQQTSAKGVVLAMQADMGLEAEDGPWLAFEPFLERLRTWVEAFPGPILLIYGDAHRLHRDMPLKDPSGHVYENFSHLGTFGSPNIGWVRVLVDTVRGEIPLYEARLMRGWP